MQKEENETIRKDFGLVLKILVSMIVSDSFSVDISCIY